VCLRQCANWAVDTSIHLWVIGRYGRRPNIYVIHTRFPVPDAWVPIKSVVHQNVGDYRETMKNDADVSELPPSDENIPWGGLQRLTYIELGN
jgi:hypothetical protein